MRKLSLPKSIALFGLMIGTLASLAHADSGLQFFRGKPGEQIRGLRFPQAPPNITTDTVGDRIREYAVIEGLYPKGNWSLIIGRIKVPRSKTGRFRVKTQLTSKQKTLLFAAVGPDGEVETETVHLNYPGFVANRRVSRHSFAFGAGLTALTYKQDASSVSEAVDFSEKTITLKASYLYKLAPPHWDLGFTAFFSTLVFSPSIADQTVRSLGLNFRIGYVLPSVKEPWRVMIMAGGYYTTMFVSPETFGFKNLSGPQLFPVVRYALNKTDTLSTYLKYSPVSNGFLKVISLSSRELAAGITYSKGLSNRHSIPISLDWSNLKSQVDATNDLTGEIAEVPVTLNTFTLGVGYTF